MAAETLRRLLRWVTFMARLFAVDDDGAKSGSVETDGRPPPKTRVFQYLCLFPGIHWFPVVRDQGRGEPLAVDEFAGRQHPADFGPVLGY